jgi:hypothetical protein
VIKLGTSSESSGYLDPVTTIEMAGLLISCDGCAFKFIEIEKKKKTNTADTNN